MNHVQHRAVGTEVSKCRINRFIHIKLIRPTNWTCVRSAVSGRRSSSARIRTSSFAWSALRSRTSTGCPPKPVRCRQTKSCTKGKRPRPRSVLFSLLAEPATLGSSMAYQDMIISASKSGCSLVMRQLLWANSAQHAVRPMITFTEQQHYSRYNIDN